MFPAAVGLGGLHGQSLPRHQREFDDELGEFFKLNYENMPMFICYLVVQKK